MANANVSKTFVLSDEGLNSYGFWVKTSGIDLRQFKKNPVMLWDHNRPWRGTKDDVLPIGTWENIRVEEGQLLADAVFDKGDDFAAEIARKVEEGVIKMCSIGFEVLADTEDVNLLKPGQKRRTVTKCKLIECSVTPFGANENSIALYRGGKLVELSEGLEEIGVDFLNNNTDKNMKLIALKLGLSETATEAEILAKVSELQAAEQEGIKLKADAKKAEEGYIANAVDTAVYLGKLSAESKEHYLELGRSMGVEFLNKTLSGLNAQVKLTTVVVGDNGAATEKSFKDYTAKELSELKSNSPETYKTLYKKEYGIDL